MLYLSRYGMCPPLSDEVFTMQHSDPETGLLDAVEPLGKYLCWPECATTYLEGMLIEAEVELRKPEE